MGTWELEVKVKPGLRTVECFLMLIGDQKVLDMKSKTLIVDMGEMINRLEPLF